MKLELIRRWSAETQSSEMFDKRERERERDRQTGEERDRQQREKKALKKRFDSIWHQGLFYKLIESGIGGKNL